MPDETVPPVDADMVLVRRTPVVQQVLGLAPAP